MGIELGTKITTAVRTRKRKQSKNLSNTAASYLVELITNSDDSYKKIESSTNSQKIIDDIKPIYIFLNLNSKSEYVFSVIDNAEGLSKESIKRIFSEYGAENAGGTKTSSRGLFGQGASDVMKTAAMYNKEAQIESIYNGEISKFQWHYDEKSGDFYLQNKPIDIHKNQLKQYREKNMIPVNGTKMTFGVPEGIKFKPKSIIEELNGQFTLRKILQAKNRKVIFIDLHKNEHVLSSSKYNWNENTKIFSEKFKFDFDNYHFDCEIKLYNDPEVKKFGIFSNKILIEDSNNVVYANTMFNWDKHPKAKNLSGVLIIDGLYDYCRAKLNNDTKEEIMYEDRTGINEKTDFYEYLTSKFINKYISDCSNKIEFSKEQVEISNDKKIKDAVNALNKLFSEETKTSISGGSSHGKTAPDDGFEFPRTKIQITEGKVYALDLIINPKQINTGEKIIIESINNDGYVEHSGEIKYEISDIKDDRVVKQITIKALKKTPLNSCVTLIAQTSKHTKSIIIEVIPEKIIYPNNGLQFEYSESVFNENQNGKKCPLWFDTDILPLGTKIHFFVDGLNLLQKEYVLSKNNYCFSQEKIGKIDVCVIGGVLGNDYELTATSADRKVKTTTKILIREHDNQKAGSNGLFNSVKLWNDESEANFQILYDYKSKTMYINPFNIINKTNMPDLINKDPKNPKFKPTEYQYLYELFSYQFAICDVKELERKNQININKNEALEDYLQKIDEKKALAYKKLFIKK